MSDATWLSCGELDNVETITKTDSTRTDAGTSAKTIIDDKPRRMKGKVDIIAT